jgi:hypothetical protein
MRCTHCGTENGDEFKFCESCGIPLRRPMGMAPEIKGPVDDVRVVSPPQESRDDEINPCRWVLNDLAEKHCEACLKFAGEYPNYLTLLERTKGAVPCYFPGYADRNDPDQMDPDFFNRRHYDGVACWLECGCHLELLVKGQWVRI